MTMKTMNNLELLLQSGLEITPGGRCTRHPDVVLLSRETGGVLSSCELCAAEHSQNDILDTPGQQQQPSQDSSDAGATPASSTTAAARAPLSRSVSGASEVSISQIVQGESVDYDSDTEDAIGSLEIMIDRWCQLQNNNSSSTSGTSNEMLSTTLILLQLQKLERRVYRQEERVKSLHNTVESQNASIKNDLSRILNLVSNNNNSTGSSVTAATQPASGDTSPTSNLTRRNTLKNAASSNNHNNGNTAPNQFSAYVGQQQDHPHPKQGVGPRAPLSRGPNLHPSSVFTSVRTIERQPPKPPKRHDSVSIMQSEHLNGGGGMSVSTSSSNMSDMEYEQNPSLPNPPPTTNHNTSYVRSADQTTPIAIVPSSAVSTTSSLSTSTMSQSAARPSPPTANQGGSSNRPTLGSGKPKTSFRNSNTPQLEIIWDASEHTNEQKVQQHLQQHSSQESQSSAENSHPTTHNDEVERTSSGHFKGKGALPRLSVTLDDDNDEESQASSRIFSGVNSYINQQQSTLQKMEMKIQQQQQQNQPSAEQQKLLGSSNTLQESVTTSLYDSFMGDEPSSSVDRSANKKPENEKAAPEAKICYSSEFSMEDTDTQDDDDSDDDSEDSGEDNNNNNDEPVKKMSKKERRKLKKELKKAKKRAKKLQKKERKEKKQSKIMDSDVGSSSSKGAHPATLMQGSKVGPSEPNDVIDKSHKKGGLKKVFWKRSAHKSSKNRSRTSSRDYSRESSRESSPIGLITRSRESSPDRHRNFGMQFSEALAPDPTVSLVNDNPRTHLSPSNTGNNKTLVMTDFDEDDLPTLADIQSATYDDDDDHHTTKTPMTAKTPLHKEPVASPLEPPPPPKRNFQRKPQVLPPSKRGVPNINAGKAITVKPFQSQSGNKKNQQNSGPPPTPPTRKRPAFPRTSVVMPHLVNSKREIIVSNGESSRMQISTLTLDTALPSADAGSVLEEVTNKSLLDKCDERGSYTGTTNEMDEPDGYGTMIYNNGAFYKGQWKEGRWHGEGILRTLNGDSYEGDFVYDCRHGRGIYKYENGDVYEGDFSSDKRHGKGTFLFQNGSLYRGDFAYGNFHGYGWYQFEDGYYEGSWVDGNYEGIGTLTYKDGSSYTGRFKGGAADGLGEEWKPDGTSRSGMWKNGVFQEPEEQPDESGKKAVVET